MTWTSKHQQELDEDRRRYPVWVDLLEGDAHTSRGVSPALRDEESGRIYAREYVKRCAELGLVGTARIHLPDEHGRPNRRLVLMGPWTG